MRQALKDLKKLEQVEVNSRNAADSPMREASTEMPGRQLKADEGDHAEYMAMKKQRTMRSNRSRSPKAKLQRQNRHAFKSQVF